MQNILLITSSFPESLSGEEAAGSFVADFSRALANDAIMTVVAPGMNTGHQLVESVDIYRFEVPKLPLSRLALYSPRDWLPAFQTVVAGNRTVSAVAEGRKIDHTLALWALPSGYWARQLWRKHGVPYTVWCLGSDIWSMTKNPVARNVLIDVLKDASIRLADGYLLAQQVSELSGMDCKFLPSTRSLNLRQTDKQASPPYRLGFLGRWHHNKGIDLLLDALLKLKDSDWARISEVRIAGGGPLQSRVMSKIAELSRYNRPVNSLGYLDKQQAEDFLLWCDYLCIPSRIDSIPVVFSDAMQAGCPVIVTPVGDMPRLMKKHNVGFMAKAVTAASIATTLRLALNISPLEFRQELLKARTEFDIDATARKFLELLMPG